MNANKVVITGGPSTGKSSIINNLTQKGYTCFEEISRQLIVDAKKEGIDQLFLTNPLLFSERLLESRKQQYQAACNTKNRVVFLDRGIPDILAYLDFIETAFPQKLIDACKQNRYDYVFILKPWKTIHTTDNERYETFSQALEIHNHLINTYKKYNYTLIDVPFNTVENRTNFILKTLNM